MGFSTLIAYLKSICIVIFYHEQVTKRFQKENIGLFQQLSSELR